MGWSLSTGGLRGGDRERTFAMRLRGLARASQSRQTGRMSHWDDDAVISQRAPMPPEQVVVERRRWSGPLALVRFDAALALSRGNTGRRLQNHAPRAQSI